MFASSSVLSSILSAFLGLQYLQLILKANIIENAKCEIVVQGLVVLLSNRNGRDKV